MMGGIKKTNLVSFYLIEAIKSIILGSDIMHQARAVRRGVSWEK